MVVGRGGDLDPVSRQMAAAPLGTSRDLPGPDVLGFVACATVVRREAFLQVGGFDDVVFFAGEEERVALDLAAAGWGMSYVEAVTAHHHPSARRATPAARQALVERNQVLTALMRRPGSVVRQRLRARTRPWPDGALATAWRAARAVRRRRPLPPDVEALAAMLHDAPTGAFGRPQQGYSQP
jgi:GT2 family glycosyltransferase